MEVVKTVENKLLKRKEITGRASADGATPTRASLRKEIAKKLKVDEKLVVVKNVSSHFGSSNVDVSANVYEDKETLEKLTLDHLKKRNAVEEPVVEEAPQEEAAPATEEAPAEEPATEESAEQPSEDASAEEGEKKEE